MKKIISMILIVILIAVQLVPILNVSAEETLVITTYGENTDGINPSLVTNKANLTVNNITNGDELSAYKIIDVFYNKGTNEMTYDFSNHFKMFLAQSTNDNYKNMSIDDYFNLTSDSDYSGAVDSVETLSTLNILVSQYTTYIRNNKINSTYDMITENEKATAEVTSGAYLILPKKIITIENKDSNISQFIRNIYGVMVGNVVFSSNNTSSSWQLSDVQINAKSEYSNLMSFIGDFSVLDYFNGNIKEDDVIFHKSYSSIFGRKYALATQIDVPFFPTNSVNKIVQIEIEFPSGVNYDKENVYDLYTGYKLNSGSILDEDGNEVGLNVVLSDQKIFLEINRELNPWGSVMLFTDIELNQNAVIGSVGNEIITKLIIADDPYIDGSLTTLNSSVVLSTYGIEITNLSKDDSTLLKGAKYEIYSKYIDKELSNKIGEFTVGDDGKASFAGVPSGTIYLKQVKSPTGYQLIKEPIAVEIATEDATAGTQEGYYQVITYNDAMWYLPSTGDIGTILYTVIGLAVIGISSIVIIKYKKRMA